MSTTRRAYSEFCERFLAKKPNSIPLSFLIQSSEVMAMSPTEVVENGEKTLDAKATATKDKKLEDLSSEEMTSKDYYFL